ncbi:MAG: baseplate J/gp47 family protein [Balneolaceae bacterium]|nr:baseplate J/gp47 family protein [Balneolaceae bacterium]
MSESCEHTNPLQREGTSQTGRRSDVLNPENVKFHDLSPDDWLSFSETYAKLINFYLTGNPENPSGDWQDFFEQRDEIQQITEEYTGGEADPFFGLFISFLKLLAFPQKSLNQLPKRHLDYYYREVLRLKEKPFQSDRVHILFELAKNAQNTLIEEGTLLDAGNDSDGNPLRYKVTSPLVVNSSNVEAIKSVFTDEGALRFAHNARHPEGLDEDADEGTTWQAFGNENWPEAELSFYVSSPILKMNEGKRTITVKMDFDEPFEKNLSSSKIKAAITTEEEWLLCETLNISAAEGSDRITLEIELKSDNDPVTGYDEEIHESGLKTTYPVLKFSFTDSENYLMIRKLKLQEIKISVDVKEIKSLRMRNELGNLDPSKPFMPFGPQPKAGSKLRVSFDEMAGKPVTKIGMKMQWLNLPANFTDHYEAYEDLIEGSRSSNLAAGTQSYNLSQGLKKLAAEMKLQLLESDDEYSLRRLEKNQPQEDFIVKLEKEESTEEKKKPEARTPFSLKSKKITKIESDDPLKELFNVRISSSYAGSKITPLFTNEDPMIDVGVSGAQTVTGNTEIELTLTESFFHDLYPKIYVAKTINASKKTDNGNGEVNPNDLPNPPYTPLLDELMLDYSAETILDVTSAGYDSEDSQITLFRQHPFGTEQVRDLDPPLLPDYQKKSLFIGLKDLKPGSNINLLFQVDEGSENPEQSHFTEEDEPDWAVLSGETWKSLAGSDIVRNNTNNFLRSGIVELQIPREATLEHSLLNAGLTWLRIRMNKPADAVPKFINIHAQACEAVFSDNSNSKDHLENNLPAETIGQLVYRRSVIKSAEQPYTSFGGTAAESSESFYRRVSERLRHKNRGVSIWDYEHLVLEQFPEIYKVKCLNHTQKSGDKLKQLAPGHITLVLIPKLPESSSPVRFYPKASQDLMDRVHSFLRSKMSLHANLHVVNPDYEEVSFEFNVKFRHGLDFNHYRNRTEEDLKKLLTPWMFDRLAEIRFGESFYKYEIIHYLENLGYIDYIENFKMVHTPSTGGGVTTKQVSPAHPAAILVSGDHDIKPAAGC